MPGLALILLAVQASSAATQPLPPEDALARYNHCVTTMATLRFGAYPDDDTAFVSAVACEGLLKAAVDQVRQAASGSPEEAGRRLAAILELQARRDAVARKSIIKSYENEKR